MRMDASFGIALQEINQGKKSPDPTGTIESLFTNKQYFQTWLRELPSKGTIAEVEAHILTAFHGSSTRKGKTKPSPAFRKGIEEMAKDLCGQHADFIEESILEKLETIRKLRDMQTS